MIDFTVLSAVLNKVILPAVTSQMYEKAPMWQLIGGWSAEKQSAERANVHVTKFDVDKIYIPVRASYHSNIVGIGVGEKYNYGEAKLKETYQSIVTLVGSFLIPKQMLNVTDKGAVVKPLVFSTKNLANDLAMDANRQVYGDGSGVVATTATSGSSSTTVDLAASTNGDIDYARYLPPGTKIKIGTNSVTTVADQTGDNQITIADAQSWSAGASIVKVTGSNTTSQELAGLAAMVKGSGSYQNLNASAAYIWKSYVDSTSETLTPSNIENKMHTAYFKANKVGKVDWIVMNAKAFQTYGNALASQKRFTEPKEVLSGGWIGLDYMGGNAKVLLDYDCPDDKIYFLSSEDLVFAQFQPLEWEKGTDGTLLKIAQELDYEVTASWMGNIGTVARAAHAALTGKTFNPAG